MFWEPSTPWFPQGNQSPSPPTEGDPEVGKTGTLVSPPARLPSAFFQMKTDMWRFPPSVALYRRMKRSRRCISNQQRDLQLSARRSLFFCSILHTLEQQQPPWRCGQPITCSGQLIFSFLLLCFSLPPALSALPAFLFFVSFSYCSSPVHLSLWHSTLTQRACM